MLIENGIKHRESLNPILSALKALIQLSIKHVIIMELKLDKLKIMKTILSMLKTLKIVSILIQFV